MKVSLALSILVFCFTAQAADYAPLKVMMSAYGGTVVSTSSPYFDPNIVCAKTKCKTKLNIPRSPYTFNLEYRNAGSNSGTIYYYIMGNVEKASNDNYLPVTVNAQMSDTDVDISAAQYSQRTKVTFVVRKSIGESTIDVQFLGCPSGVAHNRFRLSQGVVTLDMDRKCQLQVDSSNTLYSVLVKAWDGTVAKDSAPASYRYKSGVPNLSQGHFWKDSEVLVEFYSTLP